MRNLLFLILMLLFSGFVMGQKMITVFNKMGIQNTEEFTYHFQIMKGGVPQVDAYLGYEDVLEIDIKATPYNVRNTQIIMTYDQFCFDRDFEIYFQHFKRQAFFDELKIMPILFYDDLYLDGKLQETAKEYGLYEEEIDEQTEEIIGRINKIGGALKDQVQREDIKKMIIGAKTLANGYLKANNIAMQKTMDLLLDRLYKQKYYRAIDFLTKYTHQPIVIEGGIPSKGSYEYLGSQEESFGRYGLSSPFYLRVNLYPLATKGLWFNPALGAAYSKSRFVYKKTPDTNFPENTGYIFHHVDLVINNYMKFRPHHKKIGFGVMYDLGIRATYLNQIKYTSDSEMITFTEHNKKWEKVEIHPVYALGITMDSKYVDITAKISFTEGSEKLFIFQPVITVAVPFFLSYDRYQ